MPARRNTAEPSPVWSRTLRGLREARAITQDGWAARLGVGRTTVQRWETGTAPPGAEAEAALLRVCAELGLFRRFDRGPLQGETLTPERLRDLIAEARLGSDAVSRSPSAAPAHGDGETALVGPSRGNLPAAVSSFVGREREIAAIATLLDDARLVTLAGPGGIGKTRLALAVAERVAGYADGVWYVELAPVTSAALVAQQAAAVFGVAEQPRRPLVESLAERLREAAALLVLDNCEHVIEGAATLAATLLRTCPRLRLLATSRQSLGVDGEVVHRVPPLTLPNGASRRDADTDERSEAERLFIERAAAIGAAFAPTAATADAVRRICRQVDGIPLAIELAAARVRVLSAEEIAARLDDRLRLLAAGPRGLPERQRTLRATLDWSYDLLDAGERALLRRLAVFSGGCDLEAIGVVCAGDDLAHDEALDTLDRLVDKSLIVAEPSAGGSRYRLIEMVREYALDRLAQSGEADATRARHLAWCLALAQAAEAQAGEQQHWFDRLSLEHDNLRAALAWSLREGSAAEDGLRLATALRPFWFARGHVSEGRRWLARLLAAGGTSDAHARALDAAAALAHSQGDYAAAEQLLAGSLAHWRRLADRGGEATALNLLGIVAKERGDLARATRLLEEALAIRRATGEAWRVSAILNNLAAVACDAAEYERAERLSEESLAIKRDLGDRLGVAVSLANLAEIARLRGEFGRAIELADEAQALAGELGAPVRRAQALHILGAALARTGERERARAVLVEAIGIFGELDTHIGVALCCEALAEVAALAGEWERVARLLGAAEAVRRQQGAALTDADRLDRDRLLDAARAALDEAFCEHARRAGAALSLPAIVAYAAG